MQALLISDLGGDDAVTSAEAAIVRRACVLQVELERREAKFAEAGEANDREIEIYQRVSNSLRRLLESIGLQRRQRDVTTLGDILREDLRQQREAKQEAEP